MSKKYSTSIIKNKISVNKINATVLNLFLLFFLTISQIYAQAELSISSTATSQQLEAGDTISVNYTVTNSGNFEADDPIVAFYISNDLFFSSDDILIDFEELSDIDPGDSEPEGETSTIPSIITDGNYYFLLIVDPLNYIQETDETNNVFAFILTVGNPDDDETDTNKPDLFLSMATLEPGDNSPDTGDNISVEYAITNSGNQDADEFDVGFYISTDTNLSNDDIFIESDNIGNVEIGETEDESNQITVPSNLTSGIYYVILKIDYLDIILESDETNNVQALEINVNGIDPGDDENQIGEVDSIDLKQTGSTFTTINFNTIYNDPVVVVPSVSYNGSQPATTRINNITENSFDLKIAEWDYLDGNHVEENLPYFVIENGVHILEDGRIIEAGFASVSSNNTIINLQANFNKKPILFTSVVSNNDQRTAAVRVNNISKNSFRMKLQAQEIIKNEHDPELVAYIAISVSDNNQVNSLDSIRTENVVTNNWYTLNFINQSTTNPVVLVGMQTTNGGDTAVVRFRNPEDYGVEIKIEEEQSKDMEVNHIAETVGYTLFEKGFVFSSDYNSQNSVTENSNVALSNFPNPFKNNTEIHYTIPRNAFVTLKIMNYMGETIKTLVNSKQKKGFHKIKFTNRSLDKGLHFCVLTIDGERVTLKMIIE